jgi:hypothetical protein
MTSGHSPIAECQRGTTDGVSRVEKTGDMCLGTSEIEDEQAAPSRSSGRLPAEVDALEQAAVNDVGASFYMHCLRSAGPPRAAESRFPAAPSASRSALKEIALGETF